MKGKMDNKDNANFMKEFMSFVQDKGFIWGPSPEIYGGLAGFYTYGPLGKLLKNNVEDAIRNVFRKNEFWEVECPTVMQRIVWEASGHLAGFTDPMVICKKCKSEFRLDHLIKELFPGTKINMIDRKEVLSLITEKNLTCPNCKSEFEHKILDHNLMMKTTIGVNTEAYNRPETATTTYLPFPRYVNFFRKKVPFGVFQIGKAYRNEISPRQHLLRVREFTQAEGQLFIFGDQKQEFEKFEAVKNEKMPFWTAEMQKSEQNPALISTEDALKKGFIKTKAYAWTLNVAYKQFLAMGIPSSKIRLRQHHADEKAFYADDAWDIEVELRSFGWFEMCGVHDRTDYDLKQHSKFSKQELVTSDEKHKKETPHILEIAFGVDRPVFALLDIFYEKKEKEEGKTMFRVPYQLAPVKVAIFPLMKKPELVEKAEKVYDLLFKEFTCEYDDAGSIGRRYLRETETGTPYCITIDYDSLQKDDVTIRDRDSEKQIRVKVTELKIVLHKLFDKEVVFEKAGEMVK